MLGMAALVSDFCSLSQEQSVLDVYSEIANRVLDFRVAEQYLDCADVPGCAINHRRFGAAKRMSSILRLAQSNGSDPLINEPSILASAHVMAVVDPAWEHEVGMIASSSLQPCGQRSPNVGGNFELNWPIGLLLNDRGAVSDLGSGDQVPDLKFHEIAAPKLAVDCQVKEGSVS